MAMLKFVQLWTTYKIVHESIIDIPIEKLSILYINYAKEQLKIYEIRYNMLFENVINVLTENTSHWLINYFISLLWVSVYI